MPAVGQSEEPAVDVAAAASSSASMRGTAPDPAPNPQETESSDGRAPEAPAASAAGVTPRAAASPLMLLSTSSGPTEIALTGDQSPAATGPPVVATSAPGDAAAASPAPGSTLDTSEFSTSPTPEALPMPEPVPPADNPELSAPAEPPSDREAIDVVLARYQTAFSQLDANAARAVWPGVRADALERAFGQLEQQLVRFSSCSVAIEGTGATARCLGTTSYVPRVGSRTERTDIRQWQIELGKAIEGWRIVAVDSHD
jgi:hypothetical protein